MSEFYGVIYLGTCLVNRKQYIGQTTAKDPLKYISGHFANARNGNQKFLYNAIRKHGAEAFIFEVIWYCQNKVALDVSEDSFILFFDTLAPNGYNLKRGGANGKLTDELKRRISNGVSKTFARPEIKAQQIASAVLAGQRPEIKIQRRNAAKIRWSHQDQIDWRIEFNRSPEMRMKVRDHHADPKAKLKQRSDGLLGCHNRWHVRRGIVSPDCPLCQTQDKEP